MLMRTLMVAGLVGLASLVVNVATAQDALAPTDAAVDGVDFSDTVTALAGSDGRWRLELRNAWEDRFPRFEPSSFQHRDGASRRYEVALRARAPGGVGVAALQGESVGFDSSGDVSRRARRAELRLGDGVNMPRRRAQDWNHAAWYMFAAADDEALTWQPGERNDFGDPSPSFALQDRVEIGDRQAGVTYQRGPLQASLAYVERTVDARTAGRTISREERFAGVTLTMRH